MYQRQSFPAAKNRTAEQRFSKPATWVPRLVAFVLLVALCGFALAQAGRRPTPSSEGGVLISIVARRADNAATQINAKQLAVFDNGVEQTIRNFTPDPSPARIVLLV